MDKPDGGFRLSWEGRTPDLLKLARAIMRVGIGVLANDYGHDRACHADFDPARGFIQEGIAYPGKLLLETSIKPKPAISLHVEDDGGRAVFLASVFGVTFGINLLPSKEELPQPIPNSVQIVDLSKSTVD